MSMAHQTAVGVPAQYTADYARYAALRWIDSGATPQPAQPIYRPQPRVTPYARTLSPQALQRMVGHVQAPAYHTRLQSRTPPERPLTRGNSLLDFAAPPGAPPVITAGKFWTARLAGTAQDRALAYVRAVGGPTNAGGY
ncbi:MAG TPA: hypothetical protein VKQ30_23185 [Ktedonobacterales bacterium]|nr:hypothetical protein [Ktedonobacterales bacterium]